MTVELLEQLSMIIIMSPTVWSYPDAFSLEILQEDTLLAGKALRIVSHTSLLVLVGRNVTGLSQFRLLLCL